jgi:predicted enzyme related to lactoylglutathione lyase
MPNPFVHVELNAADPKKAKEFYSKMFDWQLEDSPIPGLPTRHTLLLRWERAPAAAS